jgi:RHS repeat-associated protein
MLSLQVDKTGTSISGIWKFIYDNYGTPIAVVKTIGNISTVYKYITNKRGDVLNIIDAHGEVVAEYSYDVYGNVLFANGRLAQSNPIRYAGYYYDSETSHYYLKARYYDPANGNFLSVDPHPGNEDDSISQNGYTYANINPVMYVDHSGTFVETGWNIFCTAYSGYTLYTSPSVGNALLFMYDVTSLFVPFLPGIIKNSSMNNSTIRGVGKVPAQLTRGMEFEKMVLKERGLSKNTQKVGNSIPDSLTGGRITEIKDVKYVYNSKQFRDYLNDGRPVDLIVNVNTKIAGPLAREIAKSGGEIIRR